MFLIQKLHIVPTEQGLSPFWSPCPDCIEQLAVFSVVWRLTSVALLMELLLVFPKAPDVCDVLSQLELSEVGVQV